MKKFTLSVLLCLAVQFTFAQASGNINYQSSDYGYPTSSTYLQVPKNGDVLIRVKALSNIKADTYIAIFNLTQIGKTTEEVNHLLDERISRIQATIKQESAVTSFVDMVSFVPVYEYEVEKKIFSKKTYNEIPKGFELQKNLHVQYHDPNYLNALIATCAKAEVYDLVRVDYIAEDIEAAKIALFQAAEKALQQKIQRYEVLLDIQFKNFEKDINDAFQLHYPVEQYRSYQAFSNASLDVKQRSTKAKKTKSLYYQPLLNKDFDVVLQPVVLSPVVQLTYELVLRIKRPKEQPEKEYLWLSPAGKLQALDLE